MLAVTSWLGVAVRGVTLLGIEPTHQALPAT